MVKIFIGVVVSLCLLGCAALSKAKSGGLINAKAQISENMEVKAADKITAVEQLKAADNLNAQGMGIANKNENTTTSVGGNQTVNNDASVIKEYIKTIGNMYERIINVFKAIILALIVFITKQEFHISKQNKMIIERLLNARDKDDEKEQQMLEKALNKKETLK